MAVDQRETATPTRFAGGVKLLAVVSGLLLRNLIKVTMVGDTCKQCGF